jgi:hypothetical protein
MLVGKLEGKRSLGRRKRRWRDIITTDLKYDMRVWTGIM